MAFDDACGGLRALAQKRPLPPWLEVVQALKAVVEADDDPKHDRLIGYMQDHFGVSPADTRRIASLINAKTGRMSEQASSQAVALLGEVDLRDSDEVFAIVDLFSIYHVWQSRITDYLAARRCGLPVMKLELNPEAGLLVSDELRFFGLVLEEGGWSIRISPWKDGDRATLTPLPIGATTETIRGAGRYDDEGIWVETLLEEHEALLTFVEANREDIRRMEGLVPLRGEDVFARLLMILADIENAVTARESNVEAG